MQIRDPNAPARVSNTPFERVPICPFFFGDSSASPSLTYCWMVHSDIECLCRQRQNHSLFKLRDHQVYIFSQHTFWWIAYEQWNGLDFLHLGLLDVVVFEWRFFGFALSKNLFLWWCRYFYLFMSTARIRKRDINIGGHSDDEEDASMFFLDSWRTCICRVGCWLSWLENWAACIA